jgi:hypothetical protein
VTIHDTAADEERKAVPDHQLNKQELDGICHEEPDNMFHGSVAIPRSFDGVLNIIRMCYAWTQLAAHIRRLSGVNTLRREEMP